MTRLKFKGSYEHFGVDHDNNITIDTDQNVFTCGFFDVYDTMNKRIKVQFKNRPTVAYRMGKDCSGGLYEVIEFYDTADSWYSDTIIGDGKAYWTQVRIQTWDRQELFVDFTFQHKRTHYGRIRQTSEVETCIFKLSDVSATAFAAWLETYIK